jgi:hypothetical protein
MPSRRRVRAGTNSPLTSPEGTNKFLDTDWSVFWFKGACMQMRDRGVAVTGTAGGIGRTRVPRFAVKGPAGVPVADVDESGVARFVDSLEA